MNYSVWNKGEMILTV